MLQEEKRCQTNVAPDPNSRSCSLATVWAGELGVRFAPWKEGMLKVLKEILKSKCYINFINTNRMKKIKLDLAKTNFLLSKIRDKVNSRCEIYYKWYVLRAFNGASYAYDGNYDTSNIQINCFYSKDIPKNLLSEKIYNYFDTKVIIFGEENLLVDIKDLLKSWENQFNELWNEQGSKLFSQVKRIQLWLIYLDPNDPSTGGQEFVRMIVELFGNKVLSTNLSLPISFSSVRPHEWQLDAEIIFSETLDEKHVLQFLNKFVSMQDSLFGFGIAFNNSDETNFNKNLESIHFSARHF